MVPSPIFIPLLRALVLWLNSTNFGESLKDIWTRNVKSTLSNTYREKDESVRLILSETPVGLAGKLPFIPELEAYVANRLRAALEEDDVKARETVRAAFKSQGSVTLSFRDLLDN